MLQCFTPNLILFVHVFASYCSFAFTTLLIVTPACCKILSIDYLKGEKELSVTNSFFFIFLFFLNYIATAGFPHKCADTNLLAAV